MQGQEGLMCVYVEKSVWTFTLGNWWKSTKDFSVKNCVHVVNLLPVGGQIKTL